MTKDERYNALRSIAIRCNNEMKPIQRDDLPALTTISDKYAAQAKTIGFSKARMLVEIGYINKQLVDRRML